MALTDHLAAPLIRPLPYRPLSAGDMGCRVLALIFVACLAMGAGATRLCGAEKIDIVFLIDGSSSMGCGCTDDLCNRPFDLQKAGIKNCLVGQEAYIPADGTVAISVVSFSDAATIEIPLTVVDDGNSSTSANAIAAQVDEIACLQGDTTLVAGMHLAVEVLRGGAGATRLLVISTDVFDGHEGRVNVEEALALALDIRTGTGVARGIGPTTVCTIQIALPCSNPPERTVNAFLRQLANAGDNDVSGVGPAYPLQPVGHFTCAQGMQDPGAVYRFLALCEACSCAITEAVMNDCNGNGVEDGCEPDCDSSGTPDQCDLPVDCDDDGTFDACQLTRGIDADCDGNGTLDRCEDATLICPRSSSATVKVCLVGCCYCNGLFADVDGDCDVDADDFGEWQRCYTGANHTIEDKGLPVCCHRFDVDCDGRITQTDLNVGQHLPDDAQGTKGFSYYARRSGPNIPVADPAHSNCMPHACGS